MHIIRALTVVNDAKLLICESDQNTYQNNKA